MNEVRLIRRPVGPEILLMLTFVSLIAGCWFASQRFAMLAGHHEYLGAPARVLETDMLLRLKVVAMLLASGALLSPFFKGSRRLFPLLAAGSLLLFPALPGRIYGPFSVLSWHRAFGDTPLLERALLEGAGVSLLLLAGLYLAFRAPLRRSSIAHGSAGWGEGEALGGADGLPLGRTGKRVLRYSGDGHLITIAPTRSGKGVSAVIPALLTYPGAVIVTDIKGENYAVTARCRRECFRQEVIRLAPFGDAPASLNPLDLTDPASSFDDAWLLADMLAPIRGGSEAFWSEEARALLAGLIYYVMTSKKRAAAEGSPPLPRNLLSVRRLLTLAPEALEDFFSRLLTHEDPITRRSAARFLQKADKERSGVLSTAMSHTHFLDSQAMERTLSSTNISLESLFTGNLSLYLVLPPDRLATYRAWLRLMIASQIMQLIRRRPRGRVLFLLDEFANLGRMDILVQAATLMAGYGASFWFFIQDLPRLKSVYPADWETFLANCEALQAFRSRDQVTCQYLSRRSGQQTVFVRSDSQSAPRGRPTYGSSISETGRPLIMPDEAERLPEGKALLFVGNEKPVLAERIVYYQDPLFKKGSAPIYDSNPFVA